MLGERGREGRAYELVEIGDDVEVADVAGETLARINGEGGGEERT
jgi:hypothetical protein